MHEPEISVIVPTYNRAELLRRAVQSVLKQDSCDIEIIISDNCSTDNTSKVINELRNNCPISLTYSRNDRNLGMVGNWNHALFKLARGRYAMILSDDDYLLDPTYLQKAIAIIKKHKPGLIFSRCAIVDSESEKVLIKNSSAQMSVQFSELVEPKDILLKWGRHGPGVGLGFSIMLQTAIFDRKFVLDELGGFSQDIISIDYKTWWDIIGSGRTISFIDAIGAAYAVHANNEATRNPPSMKKWIENFDCFLDTRLAKDGLIPKPIFDDEINRILFDCFLVWPGNILNIYNLAHVSREIINGRKQLKAPFFRAISQPMSIVKIIFSCNQKAYSAIRRLKIFIKKRGAEW